ncbi:MAG: hypothetical protein KC591_05085 [Gemmatimonadetes bacterium]|nr:hypothetical protein [Gemmatimonadota bacterium]
MSKSAFMVQVRGPESGNEWVTWWPPLGNPPPIGNHPSAERIKSRKGFREREAKKWARELVAPVRGYAGRCGDDKRPGVRMGKGFDPFRPWVWQVGCSITASGYGMDDRDVRVARFERTWNRYEEDDDG